jgi:hypothetical protein
MLLVGFNNPDSQTIHDQNSFDNLPLDFILINKHFIKKQQDESHENLYKLPIELFLFMSEIDESKQNKMLIVFIIPLLTTNNCKEN